MTKRKVLLNSNGFARRSFARTGLDKTLDIRTTQGDGHQGIVILSEAKDLGPSLRSELALTKEGMTAIENVSLRGRRRTYPGEEPSSGSPPDEAIVIAAIYTDT